MKQDRKGNLVIPLMNAETFKIQSLLWIFPNGFKRLKKNARKQAGIFILGGRIKNGEPIFLVEGVSTGASVAMAVGKPVIICFDAGNVPVAAELLRQRYPDSKFVICGDDDQAKVRLGKSEFNIGRIKAEEAAEVVKGRAVFPVFRSSCDLSDFNDLHVNEGLDQVREQIEIYL